MTGPAVPPSSPPSGDEPIRTNPTGSNRTRTLVALALVAAVAAVGFRSQIGEAIGPACAIGLTGTAASVTVHGWSAAAACQTFKASYTYDADINPSTPVVCQYELPGGWPGTDLFVVHDEGALKIFGSLICEALAKQQASPSPLPNPETPASPGAATSPGDGGAQARAAVDSAIVSVNSDLAGLRAVSFSANLASATAGLQAQQAHLATMRQHEQTARAETNPGARCADAGGVQADAGGILADEGGLEADQGSLEASVGSAQVTAQGLTTDFASLVSALSAVIDYRPPGMPGQPQIDAGRAAFDMVIASARATMTSDVTKAKAVADSANTEATTFAAQMCG